MALREYLGSARRALAYSLVSTLMLAVLGVARWATEVFLEGLTQERGVVRDAGIVLAVVLAFAALQPCVIRYVTRICFARWHQAGEQFRAFVDHAAHIQDAESMKRHFIDSVDALTCGQGSALYVADAEGDLRLARSTFVAAPACLRADAFRARELARGARCVRLCGIDDGVPGAWIFPMVSGGSLSGALLIGPKAGGVCYRREELAQLADGARVVGLHLESLRAADLQRSHRELELRLTEILRTSASVTPDARQD